MKRVHVATVLALFAGCSAVRDHPAAGGSDRSLAVSLATSIRVSDARGAGSRVRSEVGRLGGFVLDASADGARDIHFELRIPAARLPELRDSLASLGEVVSESERAEDVTDQRLDLGARLRNARAQEQRLLRLLDERTGTLADVIAVEKELAAVRESVERLEAQSKALETRVEMAAVSLFLSQHAPAWKTPVASLSSAARAGLETVAGLGVGLASLVAATAPTLLALALLGLGLWRAITALARWRRSAVAR